MGRVVFTGILTILLVAGNAYAMMGGMSHFIGGVVSGLFGPGGHHGGSHGGGLPYGHLGGHNHGDSNLMDDHDSSHNHGTSEFMDEQYHLDHDLGYGGAGNHHGTSDKKE